MSDCFLANPPAPSQTEDRREHSGGSFLAPELGGGACEGTLTPRHERQKRPYVTACGAPVTSLQPFIQGKGSSQRSQPRGLVAQSSMSLFYFLSLYFINLFPCLLSVELFPTRTRGAWCFWPPLHPMSVIDRLELSDGCSVVPKQGSWKCQVPRHPPPPHHPPPRLLQHPSPRLGRDTCFKTMQYVLQPCNLTAIRKEFILSGISKALAGCQ